ncbi:MAG: hypothetical protein ACRDID_15175 [Ktedonobacterales bacterium]
MPSIPQAPGFPPTCPESLWCPYDGWVVMAGLMTDVLVIVAVLLALALLIAYWGRAHAARQLLPTLLVGLCALIAVVCLRRLLQLNPQYGLGDIHYSPALAAAWDRWLAQRFALMAGALGWLAFAFATGVSLAIATLARRLVTPSAPPAGATNPRSGA